MHCSVGDSYQEVSPDVPLLATASGSGRSVVPSRYASVHRIICEKTREITRLRGRLRKLNASAWPKGTAIARVVRLIPFSRTALMSG